MSKQEPKRTNRTVAAAKRFAKAREGNVALIFSLCAVPLILAGGAAIDYTRATAAESRMTQALDAAALAVGNSPGLSNADMRALALRYFRQNYPNASEEIDASIKVSVNNDRVSLSIDAEVPTTLMRVMGYKSIPLHISNEVVRNATNLEVALALDVTGSMGTPNSKIAALKVAAKDLVDILVADTQTNFYSKMALVPYSNSVSVGANAVTLRGAVTAGTCTTPGCEKYKFDAAAGGSNTFDITTCVTERTGPQAYTDASVIAAKLGRHYALSAGSCIDSEVVPLSTDKSMLKAKITGLETGGPTAGHIGIAWAWYMLSPNFASLWPAASQPANYGAPKLVKAAVIMTDGVFNTAYCNGVVSRDSSSSRAQERINCNATNGDPNTQALALCTGMKNAGITVYTVGFDLVGQPVATQLLRDCATSPAYAYSATTGDELKTAFADIGLKLSQLRLSK